MRRFAQDGHLVGDGYYYEQDYSKEPDISNSESLTLRQWVPAG